MATEIKDIMYYKRCFLHLTRSGRKGEKAPHKPILLLAMIDRVESLVNMGIAGDRMIHQNLIDLNPKLEQFFYKHWNTYVTSEAFSPSFSTPFYHMEREPFWKLVLKKNAVPQGGQNETNLYKFYIGAEIDEELMSLLLDANIREELRTFLINMLKPTKTEDFLFQPDEFVSEQETETSNEDPVSYGKTNSTSKEIVQAPASKLSKQLTDKIAHDHLGRSFVGIEEEVKSRVPATFMGYLQDNDHDVCLRLMYLLSDGCFTIEGVLRSCKIYKTPNTSIQRFFINKNDWMKLSLPARRRWADTPFRYNGEIYFITNQIDGHDIEGKNNVRINDFAIFIYEGSEHKYFVNFIENGLDHSSAKYIHELRHIV